MPPVVPRITITYIERDIATNLHDLQLQESDPFLNNVDKLRENWLSNQIEEPIDERFVEAKKEIIDIHKSLQQFVKKIDPGLSSFAGKTSSKLMNKLNCWKEC